MNKALQVLDKYEETRQKAKEMPEQYPVDYTIRILEAIFSQAVGFKSRLEWEELLKKDPESWYSGFTSGKIV